MRIGFEEAGGRCVFSSEWDRWAQLTYFHNFGEIPDGDIRKIPSEAIPDHDVLLAGFPCQPFSIAGVSKKNALSRPHGFLDETQGTLFFEVERIVRAKRPRAVVLENVRNLVSHDKGRTLRVIVRHLRAAGYVVNWALLSARPYVPQSRVRIFIVALKGGPAFTFPPVSQDARYPVMADILEADVPSKYTLTDHLWRYLQAYAEKHRALGNGFGFGLAPPDGIARTLSARYYKDGSEILIPQEGRNPRRLTPTECRKLMGFPTWFEIPEKLSDTQAYKQFGNSVVVPLVEHLAKALVPYLSSEGNPDPCPQSAEVGTQVPLGLV